MNVLSFIIFIVIYLIIGGFVSGLIHSDFSDESFYWIFLWPLGLIFLIMCCAVYLPMKAGEIVREWFEGEEEVTDD